MVDYRLTFKDWVRRNAGRQRQPDAIGSDTPCLRCGCAVGDPLAEEGSRTTHALAICTDACRLYAGLIVGALKVVKKESLLSAGWSPESEVFARRALIQEIRQISNGSYLRKRDEEIRGSGYVAASLEAALWAFAHAQDFESGLKSVVSLGEDTDTTGAIYGQFAGAYWGLSQIPKRWRDDLMPYDMILDTADALYRFAIGRMAT